MTMQTKMKSRVSYRDYDRNFQNEEINSGNIVLKKELKLNIWLKCGVEYEDLTHLA